MQLVLTDVQVGLLQGATQNALTDAANEQEATQIAALSYFLDLVAGGPAAFPVTDAGMRRSIRKNIARVKGPAQPKRKNARKRTQERKIGFQKRARAEKQAAAKLFNEAREAALEALALEESLAQRERAESLGIVLPE